MHLSLIEQGSDLHLCSTLAGFEANGAMFTYYWITRMDIIFSLIARPTIL